MAVQILLIDSNIGFIVRLKQALEEQQYDVRTVGRPKAALAALTQSKFDVAVIDLALEDLVDLVALIREHQPSLPVIFSGSSADDPEKVNQYGGQAYIHKPYVARDLIPIIELACKQIVQDAPIGIAPHEAQQRDGPQQKISFEIEPPIDDEATIGDLVAVLNNLDLEAAMIQEAQSGGEELQQPLPPDTLPESVSMQSSAAPRIQEPPISSDDSPASVALRLTNDEAASNTMLIKAQSGDPILIHSLPSWSRNPTPEELAQIDALLGAPSTKSVETPPFGAGTQPYSLPEIDLLPDPEDTSRELHPLMPTLNPELLEALADAENVNDPRLQAILSDMAPSNVPPEEEALVQNTVEEITQAMGVVLPTEDDEAFDTDVETDSSPDAEAVNALLVEIDAVARAALQLTQLSLESSALGTLLTHSHHPVARTGSFSEQTWKEILDTLSEGWQRDSGSSRTRVLYRNTRDLGQIMLYSTYTVDELTLTMIFAADTPLRIIRRQAARLMDALLRIPIDDFAVPEAIQTIAPPPAPEIEAPLPAPPQDEAVEAPPPPAAVTLPSRPTDLKPPEALREALQAPIPAEKPKREPGTYMGYACLWLLQTDQFSLTNSLADGMQRWLRRTADANDWDVIEAEVGESWVNLHLEVPIKTLPRQVIQTMMQSTQRSILEATGHDPETPSIWASGYNVTTPGRLLSRREIERFIRFQAEQAIG